MKFFVIFILIIALALSSYEAFIYTEFLQAQNTVTVSADVATSVSCNVSTSTTAFGTLSVSVVNVSSPNVTTTLSCNFSNGCNLKVSDQGDSTNGGLYKGNAPTHLIPSPNSSFSATATLVAGTEGYGIQGATTTAGSGGTLTLSARYNVTGDTVGGLTTTSIALASSSEPVSNREVVVTHKAAISGLTKGGSYSDTITYSCAGNP